MTQAIGTLGVYGQPGYTPDGEPTTHEVEVLALADEYRERLCAALQTRHRRLTDLRNAAFPSLFSAMVESEATAAKIHYVESQIKKHHSDVRDKNAVTVEQRDELERLRERRAHWKREITEHRRGWLDTMRAHAMYWSSLEDWKNVKSLAKRESLYERIRWPRTTDSYYQIDAELQEEAEAKAAFEEKECSRKPLGPINADVLAELGQIEMECDLVQRRLSVEYQERGLHSAIRAEIVEASQPKLTKTGPGMRYTYHRDPEPRPWEKLSIHFPGGLTIADAIAGKNASLRLEPVYTHESASRSSTVYECHQQIGTAKVPRVVTYRLKCHRPLPEDAIIKRWSLVVREDGRRVCIPILDNHGLEKPVGDGTFGYDLTWRTTPDGIQVCHFVGDHVNERLVLPRWLIDARLACVTVQQECDHRANEVIIEHTGTAPEAGGRHGVAALEAYCATHPTDTLAFNELDECQRKLRRAKKTMQRAVRCIESIYETVARRVCSLHSEMVADEIDLARIKRYDTRDLLRHDVLPSRSREYLAAVSPGKLRAALHGYGLARATVAWDSLPVARETDLFTSWVRSLGVKTGPKEQHPSHRSQHRAGVTERE